ncbi:UreD urease accessory protein-domain-containing protein [Macrophomina phaseolina]|uniref:UreD urease accessory protein-domain-containing protein n=1 Tax=Macrophomina phaseolina TaxID=35725 RepID=A0ABQ8GVU8_9PEZI|nr:UreD urease accessory protein-domain-containing protein [Macrophomina phaseolina]
MNNPFAPSTSKPGHGFIILDLLPPATPVLRTVSYQYPLKLIAPEPLPIAPNSPLSYTPRTVHSVHTVFVLTYGGGLVAGDTITLRVALAPATRLALLTQGSTKIFKAPSAAAQHRSGQTTDVRVAPGAALCFLPDPVQPFAESGFVQRQRYTLLQPPEGADNNVQGGTGSLCVLDWVSEGRSARGERWDFYTYVSKNEVWDWDKAEDGRLLLRDNVILHNEGPDGAGPASAGTIVGRMDGLAAFGTLIVLGPVFEKLGKFFLDEFAAMPRIGAKQWHTTPTTAQDELTLEESWRAERLEQEAHDGVLWTAAAVRGSVLVKFGAKSVEGARRWLGNMIRNEGTVEKEFGERAVLCMK